VFDRENIIPGDYVPIQITMKAGVKDAYVDAVEQFLDKNSKKKSEDPNLGKRVNPPNMVAIKDLNKGVVRGYTLGKQNARSMLKLNKQFLSYKSIFQQDMGETGFFPYFKLTLLGEGERRLAQVVYYKQKCNTADLRANKRALILAPYGGLGSMKLRETLPRGDIIATKMKPLSKEEILSYDFDKSPRPDTKFFTCRIEKSDYASNSIGYVFTDKRYRSTVQMHVLCV
jgi:hypothetical protein